MRLLPPPDADPARAGEVADRVLSRPEYREDAEPLLDRALDWVGDRVGDLFGSLAGGGRGALVSVVLLVVLGAALVLLLVRLVRAPRGRGRTGERGRGGPADAELEVALRRSSARWRADAVAAEAEGRWKDALRARYRALVAELAERGVLDERPASTTGEDRRALAERVPGAEREVAAATELFEAAWYGGADVGAGDVERLAELAGRVLSITAGAQR